MELINLVWKTDKQAKKFLEEVYFKECIDRNRMDKLTRWEVKAYKRKVNKNFG